MKPSDAYAHISVSDKESTSYFGRSVLRLPRFNARIDISVHEHEELNLCWSNYKCFEYVDPSKEDLQTISSKSLVSNC